MSIQRARFEISSTEFLDWVVYLDEEERNGFHREDYYLANIAKEIRQSYVKDASKVKLDSFLIKFQREDKPKKKKVKKVTTMKERTRKAKAFWLPLVKYSKRKK